MNRHAHMDGLGLSQPPQGEPVGPQRGEGGQYSVGGQLSMVRSGGTIDDESVTLGNTWAFPSSEVIIQQGEDGVLGRGSYGEVRVATWRGLRVAAKQLHALCGMRAENISPEQMVEVRRDLLMEMRLLASLRHPNLVLFLGVTYDERSHEPRSIITELLPSSVYDILETKRMVLDQSEILDVAGDVCRGMAYLHGHSPAIVHRDLSSRNVLYDGRVARLADLGQAKAMGTATAASGSRQTAMPGAMVYAAPEVLTGHYTSSIDIFSFGVLFAQVMTGEYPRLDRRHEQVAEAGERFPLLRPLLERCLSLHAEDRPAAAEALRAVDGFRADPCVYRPAGHGAGLLADRWFKAELKERTREVQARLNVRERRLSAEMGRWKQEADRADEMSGRIDSAERERDAALKRQGELEESLAGALNALDEEGKAHDRTRRTLHEVEDNGRALRAEIKRLEDELLRSQRALKSAETLQGLAEGNSSLAQRAASDAKEARTRAELRAEQAEAQLAGQAAATREAEVRLGQAIARWEGEKVERLRYKKDFFRKCSEGQERERTIRELRVSLEEAAARLATYDGLPESEQIRQRMIDLEADRQRAEKDTKQRDEELEEKAKAVVALTHKIGALEVDQERAREAHAELEERIEEQMKARSNAVDKAERASRAMDKAHVREEEAQKESGMLKAELLRVTKEMKRARKDAPWLFKGGGRAHSDAVNVGRSRAHTEGFAKTSCPLSSPPGTANGSGDRGGYSEHGPWTGLDSDSSSGSSGGDDQGRNRVQLLLAEARSAGPKGVTELLRRYPKRSELQRQGLRLLRDLAYSGDGARCAVGAAGGVTVAVASMKRFATDAKIQVSGMRTLAHLAFGNDVNRIEVGSCGGTAAIVRAMAAFPADVEVQGEACTAFTNLSHNCDRNKRLIVEAGGLILILDAMQGFPGDPKLQRQACWALLTLAANDELSVMIASEGGVGAIIAAMINNAGDSSVQHFGCWALANVAWGQVHVQEFSREEGALEVIQAGIRRFPEHEALVAKARLALDVISRKTIEDSGQVEAARKIT